MEYSFNPCLIRIYSVTEISPSNDKVIDRFNPCLIRIYSVTRIDWN